MSVVVAIRLEGWRRGLAIGMSIALAHSASATIIQLVACKYWQAIEFQGNPLFASEDSFQSPPEPPRTVSAMIQAGQNRAHSSAGPFGNLGMSAFSTLGGSMLSAAFISSDEFMNPAGVPQFARANFVIDGGRLAILGAPHAELNFELELQAKVYDSVGQFVGSRFWRSRADLVSLNFGAPGLLLGGQDIGIRMGTPYEASIPLSLQTFDIGVPVPANGSIYLSYFASARYSSLLLEGAYWDFSDPLSVGGMGEFPHSGMGWSPVPEPSSLVCLAGGVFAWIRRRQTR